MDKSWVSRDVATSNLITERVAFAEVVSVGVGPAGHGKAGVGFLWIVVVALGQVGRGVAVECGLGLNAAGHRLLTSFD